jgi:hypothetical protein
MLLACKQLGSQIFGRSVSGNKELHAVFWRVCPLLLTCHAWCYIFSTTGLQCCIPTIRRLLIILLWINTNCTPCDDTPCGSDTTVHPGRVKSSSPPLHHDAICICAITMKYGLLSTECAGGSRSSLTIYIAQNWETVSWNIRSRIPCHVSS